MTQFETISRLLATMFHPLENLTHPPLDEPRRFSAALCPSLEKKNHRKNGQLQIFRLPKIGLGVFLLYLGTGCASVAQVEERYVGCSYDQVWDSAVNTLKELPLSEQNKEAGILETDWVESPIQNRPYGLFSREGIEEKQRYRTRVELTPRKKVTVLRVSERRQHWGFRGGAPKYKWFPVEPSETALQQFLNNLITPLEKQGCLIEA